MYAVLFVSTVLLCLSVLVTGEDVPAPVPEPAPQPPPNVPLVLIPPGSEQEAVKPETAPADNAAIPDEVKPPLVLTNQTVESIGPVIFSSTSKDSEASNAALPEPGTGNATAQVVPNSVDSESPTLSERKQPLGDILGISPDKIGSGLGSFCKNTSDCKIENTFCQGQSCLCKDGYHASTLRLDACVQKPKALGQSCERDAECDLVAINSVCSNNVCECPTDFVADQGACWELKGLGVACETNIQCNEVLNASCLQGVCACPSDHVPSPVSNKCLLVAKSYQSECLEDIQCTESMGDNSRCNNNECICKDDYHYNGTICLPDLKLGSPCVTKEDCTVSLATEPAGQRTCLNSNCSCATGFRVLKGEDNCVKGAADQISISLSWMMCVIIAKYFI